MIRLLYTHIDGLGHIEYDTSSYQLAVTDALRSSFVPIGPNGLVELGLTLTSLGYEMCQADGLADVSTSYSQISANSRHHLWRDQLDRWLDVRPYDPDSGGRLEELQNIIQFIEQHLSDCQDVYRSGDEFAKLPAGAARSAQ